jgi:hypothetical protein
MARRGVMLGATVPIAVAVICALSSSAAALPPPPTAPVDLGTAYAFSVLGSSEVTSADPSVIGADLGVSPGTSITGVLAADVGGTIHDNDAAAIDAQADATAAFTTAAGLTPAVTGLTNLTSGTPLTPGVYSGGALLLNGSMTLDGGPTSVWVFQATSTLTVHAGSHVLLTGGASSCNVFWDIASSATIGTDSDFVGTILAGDSITAATGATITGRLLATTDAVTLDANHIIAPSGCSPTITSGSPTRAVTGRPYSFAVTATGSTAPTFAVSAGALPPGLSLDTVTGLITGTPTVSGVFSFSITASNGLGANAVRAFTITAGPALADTGIDPTPGLFTGFGLALLGALLLISRLRKPFPRRERRP